MFCTFYDEKCMAFLLMASVFSMKSIYSFDIYLLNAHYKPEALQSTSSREQESDYSQENSLPSGKAFLINLKKKFYLKIFIYSFKKREPEQKSAYCVF